ncbi:unnamed protein product, partial [Thlaspi arvense]
METETDMDTLQFDLLLNVSNTARNLESTNTVLIRLHVQILDDESRLTPLRSDRIYLKPRGCFSPSHLSQLFDEQEVRYSQVLGETIHRQINECFANDHSLREPVYVTVNVNIIEDRRTNVNVPPPSTRASWEVIQRLGVEQRVELMDLEDTYEIQCSICIEDLSKSNENIIKMPQCKHMFHRNCLFEWLGRQNSCPLCRTVTYGESRNSEFKVGLGMPQCKHMFHQDCLFEWLGRQNSCPLCRTVPYGESRNSESKLG